MPTLTPREITCLKWVAAGKTSLEVGMILEISARTVDHHIDNACTKLGVNNRQAAIATAISWGLLPNLHKLLPRAPAKYYEASKTMRDKTQRKDKD